MGNEQSYDRGGSFDLHDGGTVTLPPLDPNMSPVEEQSKELEKEKEKTRLEAIRQQELEPHGNGQGMEVVDSGAGTLRYRDSDEDEDSGDGGGRSHAAQVGGNGRKGSAAGGRRQRQGRSNAATAAAGSPEDPDGAAFHKKLGYIQMARMGYQELVNAIIRPPRADYKIESLGPPAFTFCGRRFTRTDFVLQTSRGLSLQCSHWEPVERTADRIPAVIYMHGNSSARVEVIPQLSYLLSLGVAVFAFDFAGSGKSDGDFVSLGYYEREDLMSVVAHLRGTNVVSTIALWGRSMGAATSLMHGDRDPSIACMILDSSFADLSQLAEEMVDKGREQGIFVPNVVVSIVIRMIKSSVMRQANFNIKHISPIAHADKCFIPALFVAGEHDDFINPSHSQAIYDRYAGDKNLIIVEGDHNSPRPKFMFDSVSIFLQTCLQIPQSWALDVHPTMNLMAPPWYNPGFSRNILPSMAGQKARQVRRPSSPKPAFDELGIGFTAERQREVQASLFKMLGQPDEPSPPKSKRADSPTSLRSGGSNAGADQTEDPTLLDTETYTGGSLSASASELMHASTLPSPWLDPTGTSAHTSVDDSVSFSYRPTDVSGEMDCPAARAAAPVAMARGGREKHLAKALEDLSEESEGEEPRTATGSGRPIIAVGVSSDVFRGISKSSDDIKEINGVANNGNKSQDGKTVHTALPM